MKNKKFWITASILAVIIIVVVMVLRFGGKKVKLKPGNYWTFRILPNGTEIGDTQYDEEIEYAIIPFNYREVVLYPNTELPLTLIPIKAVVLSGQKKRIKVPSGIYISKADIEK